MVGKPAKKEVTLYIREQMDSGHSVESIKAHLLKYGHTHEEIDLAIDEILKDDETINRKAAQRAVEILYTILFVIFIFWVGASSKSPGETLLFGFSPILIYMVLSVVLIENVRRHNTTLSLLPIALCAAFFIIGKIGTIPIFSQMEIGKLTILNLILSYIFLLAIHSSELLKKLQIETFIEEKIMSRHDENEENKEKDINPNHTPFFKQVLQNEEEEMKEKEAPGASVYLEVPQKEDDEPVEKIIQSIESNCKTLNSVIGRVYRKSNGGTKLVRDLIEIKKEWYNEFNDLVKTKNKEKITLVIDKIERRLNYLFRTEKELFGNTQFRNLKRDGNGNSRIIDVLIMNDSDPVETYFENALALCGKVREKTGNI